MNQHTQDRNTAILWARSILARAHEYYILDTETTGLDNPEIIELAVINLTGEMIINQRFNPITPISEGAFAIHGITSEKLATSPKFTVVKECFDRIICQRKLLIYNYRFDYKALQNTYDLHRMTFSGFGGECLMEWFCQFVGEWDGRTGNYLPQNLPGGDHTALGDCLATLEVLRKMAGSPLRDEDAPIVLGSPPFEATNADHQILAS
jgi:DNA polymerase III subunit epsilon